MSRAARMLTALVVAGLLLLGGSAASGAVAEPLRVQVTDTSIAVSSGELLRLDELPPGSSVRVPVEVHSRAGAQSTVSVSVVDLADAGGRDGQRLSDRLLLRVGSGTSPQRSLSSVVDADVDLLSVPSGGVGRTALTLALPARVGNEMQGSSVSFGLQWTLVAGGSSVATTTVPVTLGENSPSIPSRLSMTGVAPLLLVVLGITLLVLGSGLMRWSRRRPARHARG
jgi:hypothetical protein